MQTKTRSLAGQLVLIVEDEIDVAQRLSIILKRRGGAETLHAATVQAAQSIMEDGANPDVVLLDHNLGTTEIGTTLARWIRARPGQRTKVVSYSAQPQETIIASCEGEPLFEMILTKGTTTFDELVCRLRELSSL